MPPALQNIPDIKKAILKSLWANPQQRSQGEKLLAIQGQVQHFSGPLPRPDILAGFEKVCQGSANRIIVMAEKAQDKNNERADAEIRKTDAEIEILKKESQNAEKLLDAQIKQSILALIFCMILVILCLLAGGFFAYIDRLWTASLFGGGGVASVIWAFSRFIKIPTRKK